MTRRTISAQERRPYADPHAARSQVGAGMVELSDDLTPHSPPPGGRGAKRCTHQIWAALHTTTAAAIAHPIGTMPDHSVASTISITRPKRVILLMYVAMPNGSTRSGLPSAAQAITTGEST